MSYTDYRGHYHQAPIITYSRDSSQDSRDSSYYSRSSEDGHYSSNTSSAMAGGYYSGSQSKHSGSYERKYRDPHDDRKYVSSYTRDSKEKDGRSVEVVQQKSGRYDVDEPRSADASYDEYKTSKKRSSKHRKHH